MAFSRTKFLALASHARHKKCYELMKKAFLASPEERKSHFHHYAILCEYLSIPPLDSQSSEAVEERFHYHIAQSGMSLRESEFLISVTAGDKEEAKEWLGVWTYLDSLRSAHNVGSIVRTVEAFRLGPIRFSSSMLIAPSHPQVQKTSMDCFRHVDMCAVSSFEELPRPWIALETVLHSPALHTYSFTSPCTLIVGNEERGVSRDMLKQADAIVHIPLRGRKNSLNVACAFAILAAQVSSQQSINE